MNLRDRINSMFKTSKTDADAVRSAYYKNHAYCPKCGGSGGTRTLLGCIVDLSNPSAFHDRNKVYCSCGDVHLVHDRIPTK